MLLSYGDESYGPERRTFAVAGLLAGEEEWREIDEEWTARTGGEIFHAAECEADQGIFARHSHSNNLTLYRDLTQIVARSRVRGFGAAMDVASFNEIFVGAMDNQPYFMCFDQVVSHFADWIAKNAPEEQVKFTFDRNRDVDYNAHYLYEQLRSRNDWANRLYLADEFSTATRATPRIQVADLLARETMKALDRSVAELPSREAYNALQQTGRFTFSFSTRIEWERLRKQMDKESLPGEFMRSYRSWLSDKRIQDNETRRIEYLNRL